MAKDGMLLYGRNSVYERLKAKPRSVRSLLLQDNVELGYIEKLARKNHVSVEHVSPRQLSKMKHAKDLQGVVAIVNKFSYASFDDLLNQKTTLIFPQHKRLNRCNNRKTVAVHLKRVFSPQVFGSSWLVNSKTRLGKAPST